jgi:hypothetical protein
MITPKQLSAWHMFVHYHILRNEFDDVNGPAILCLCLEEGAGRRRQTQIDAESHMRN